jgi:hypothetical protein
LLLFAMALPSPKSSSELSEPPLECNGEINTSSASPPAPAPPAAPAPWVSTLLSSAPAPAPAPGTRTVTLLGNLYPPVSEDTGVIPLRLLLRLPFPIPALAPTPTPLSLVAKLLPPVSTECDERPRRFSFLTRVPREREALSSSSSSSTYMRRRAAISGSSLSVTGDQNLWFRIGIGPSLRNFWTIGWTDSAGFHSITSIFRAPPSPEETARKSRP